VLEDPEAAVRLNAFLDDLQEEVQGVQGVYMNWAKGEKISDELWEELRGKVAV
jgi:hypothetical protein